jgi:hypothetical protein
MSACALAMANYGLEGFIKGQILAEFKTRSTRLVFETYKKCDLMASACLIAGIEVHGLTQTG